MATIWCNGEWLDSDEPGVAWSDRGLLHGLGLFETLLSVDGTPVHADRHLARMAKGLERLDWDRPDHDLVAAMRELIKRNSLSHGRARIRLAMSAGSGVLNDLAVAEDHKIWMTASALAEGKESVSLGLSLWRRNEHSPLAGLKCASYAENLVALDWGRREGYDEVVFLNTAGHLSEAATANLFMVKDGLILTPSLESGCLSGVTRELVLGFAGSSAREAQLTLQDLEQAEECFLTSATRGVLPVTSFGVNRFQLGSVTRELAEQWESSLSLSSR